MSEQEQLPLIPSKPLKFVERTLKLTELPPDEELVGPVPTPEMIQQTRDLGTIVEPIICQQKGDAVLVIRGRRRVKAARVCGLTSIRARILPEVDWQIGVSLDLSAHATRKDNAAAEVVAIRRLMEEGCTEKHISQATGLQLATIQKRLELVKLIDVFYQAMLKGKIAPSVCEALAGLPASTQEALAEKFKEAGKLTAKDVHEAKRARREESTATLPWEALTATKPDPAPPTAPTRESLLESVKAYLEAAEPDQRASFLEDLSALSREYLPAGEADATTPQGLEELATAVLTGLTATAA